MNENTSFDRTLSEGNPCSDEELSVCRRIWSDCFHDSAEFMDLYFSRRARKDNTFVSRTQDGQIVAQAQCFIYQMSGAIPELPDVYGQNGLGKSVWAYVSGLATLPQYRGQGHAQRVMCLLHNYMRTRQADYAFLLPADDYAARWYEKHFGYAHTCNYTKLLLSRSYKDVMTEVDFQNAEARWNALEYMEKNLESRPHTLLHTLSDLSDQWQVCRMEGGGLYYMSFPKGEAYFFLTPYEHGLVCLEQFKDFRFSLGPNESGIVDMESTLLLDGWKDLPVLTMPICAATPAQKEVHVSLLLD